VQRRLEARNTLNLQERERIETDFMRKITEWQAWHEKYERVEFEKVWNEKEAEVQDENRRRRDQILTKAQKPAFTAQKFTIVQVSPFKEAV